MERVKTGRPLCNVYDSSKTNNRTITWPNYTSLGMYQRLLCPITKIQDIHSYCSSVHNIKEIYSPHMSINRWLDNKKKNEMKFSRKWIDLRRIILREVTQTQNTWVWASNFSIQAFMEKWVWEEVMKLEKELWDGKREGVLRKRETKCGAVHAFNPSTRDRGVWISEF